MRKSCIIGVGFVAAISLALAGCGSDEPEQQTASSDQSAVLHVTAEAGENVAEDTMLSAETDCETGGQLRVLPVNQQVTISYPSEHCQLTIVAPDSSQTITYTGGHYADGQQFSWQNILDGPHSLAINLQEYGSGHYDDSVITLNLTVDEK